MRLKFLLTLSLLLFITGEILADEHEDLPTYGVERKSSSYFRDRYQYNDLSHYLDNLNLYSIYQIETTGMYNLPDQLVFSLEGNSYKWNNYYLDNFRIDSRFFAGSTLYKTDLYTHDLSIDYFASDLFFEMNKDVAPSATVSGNFGGIGGISPGTDAFVHLFHETANDRAYKSIDYRNQINGAATANIYYGIKRNEKLYNQSLYFDFGKRSQVFFDNNGIDNYMPESFGHLQLQGELPIGGNYLFDKSSYIAHYTYRDNLYSEFYFGDEEGAVANSYSVSLYGNREREDIRYSSGVTFAAHSTKHNNINFSRNILDQDGEGFDPWYQDGVNYEFSHALNLTKRVNSWLNLNFDSYNSFLYTQSTAQNFENVIFAQEVGQESAQLLYLYEWNATSFASGLLENSLGISTERRLSRAVEFRADLDLTLDAMLLKGESMVRPNIEASLGFAIKPVKWFSMEVNMAKKRVSYNIDDIRFLSDDYMNGDIYYINDSNNDGIYQEGEKGGYFTSTGGKYRTTIDGLRQQSYFLLDIPINLTFGRHRLSLLQSYRKYYNCWLTSYDKPSSEYGYTVEKEVGEEFGTIDLFYLNGGESVNYLVGYYPNQMMGDSFINSTPYYFCSNIQYSYTSPKFLFSIGWQSYMMSGASTLGNGVLHNTIGALSESSANPNSSLVDRNSSSIYQATGRMDQDRAYVARIFASYNVNDNLSLAMNMKFKDGQPFSIMHSEIYEADSGNQIAIYPSTTRGTNTFDGNFGTREDAFFNVDLRATYRWEVANRKFELQANSYNLYDFGTELTEYVFDEPLTETRRAMSLNIPRGVIFSLKVDF